MFDIQLLSHGYKPKKLIVSDNTKIHFIKQKSGFNNCNVELIYNGEILEEDRRLIDYNINNDACIFVIKLNSKTLQEIKESNNLQLIDSFINIINQYNNQYENELVLLESMGFFDHTRNTSLLTLYNGNIELVASALLDEI
jgi:hypothetical protein